MDQPTNITNTNTQDGVENIATSQAPKKESKGKRGRRTSAIRNAFSNVPTEPVDLEEFAKEYNVSTAVLRQVKRFDDTGLDGKVNIKMNKVAKKRMIWRENSSNSTAE